MDSTQLAIILLVIAILVNVVLGRQKKKNPMLEKDMLFMITGSVFSLITIGLLVFIGWRLW